MTEKKQKQGKAVEAARVAGMKVEKVVDAQFEMVEVDDDTQIAYRILDKHVTDEITNRLSGHFDQELIYNTPRRTASGKLSHPECDLMPYGCSYKGKDKHIHIVGIGYQGALQAMRAYGGIEATVPNMPEVVDQGGKLVWAAYAEAVDMHTGVKLGRWYFQDYEMKSKGGRMENPFGASIAESKALRNVILALLPKDLLQIWKEDYKSGGKQLDHKRAEELGYKEPVERKALAADTKKEVITPGAKKEYEEDVDQLATTMGLATSDLSKFMADPANYPTQAKRLVNVKQALNNETLRQSIRSAYDTWSAPPEEEPPDSEQPELLDKQGKKHNPPE